MSCLAVRIAAEARIGGIAMFGIRTRELNGPPHGMYFSVDSHAQPLKMLLFVRCAWTLAQELDIPDLYPAPDVGSSALPDDETKEIWEQRWVREWERAWEWYDTREAQTAPISREEMGRLSRSGQPLNPAVPPFWVTEYGMAGLDWAAFCRWDELTTTTDSSFIPKLKASEIRSAGIRNITVLPYSGYFAERRNVTHLVVSGETIKDTDLFRRAFE